MTVKKCDIVENLAMNVSSGLPTEGGQRLLFPEMKSGPLGRTRAARIVESVFELIKAALSRGEDVQIAGFGKFHVRFKWARRGRNPATGEPMMLRARRVVVFYPSRRLRDRMNGPV